MTKVHRWRVVTLAAGITAALGPAWPAEAAGPTLTHLRPGDFREVRQSLPINVVFVGYEKGASPRDIDLATFRAGLPAQGRPVNRTPDLYGQLYYGTRSFTGLSFSYDYNFVFADTAFEDAFFGYLNQQAVPRGLTLAQAAYNTQSARSLNVTDDASVDVTMVERWLALNSGPMLGVDTSHYTVFLINWFGRPDFRFHIYVKLDEPDPDTGVNFGALYAVERFIGWGGTTPDDAESGLGSLARIWYFDLSAGPEINTDNWNLDNGDLDGDGSLDYRMPPIWEYGNSNGYRPFTDLSGDLAKIVRYVALDELFTASPIYDPAIHAPLLPNSIQVDVNLYQADPAADARPYFNPSVFLAKESKVQPLTGLSVEMNIAPYGSEIARVDNCFNTNQSCFGQHDFGVGFYDLDIYYQNHLFQFIEGDADYEIPAFLFNNVSAQQAPLLGYASDNLRNGAQAFTYVYESAGLHDVGYGFTRVLTHEVGHHLGLSHPHDGYDSTADLHFGPAGSFYFVWAGDESNTVMNYLHNNGDFSQFDRDNMNRWLLATYLKQADQILVAVYSNQQVATVSQLLLAADAKAGSALAAYGASDWAGAAALGKQAYLGVLAAADRLNISLAPEAWQGQYRQNLFFVDSFGDRFGQHLSLDPKLDLS